MPKSRGLVDRSELPHLARPSGWFQIAWSHDLGNGDVAPAKYFGRDLVIYRTAAGRVFAADAFCPHFGAHLGYGGTVVGECLQCPFHGWSWNTDGRNEAIPYSAKVNTTKQLVHHPVHEVSGLILMWHDATGAAPSWNLPAIPEFDDADGYFTPYPGGWALHRDMRFPPQFVVENNADFAHFRYVHGWETVPEVSQLIVDGARFFAEYTGEVATAKGRTSISISSDSYGVGLTVAKLSGVRGTVSVTAVTPVDGETSHVRMSTAVQRLSQDTEDIPKVVTGIRRAQTVSVIEQDGPIWENQAYNLMPPYPKEEAKDFLTLRRWTEQFYPQTSL